MSEEFDAKYGFKKENKEVVIRHCHNGNLRVNPDDLDAPDEKGGFGKFARWIVEFDGDLVRIKSKKTGKYLRIKKNKEIDVGGGTGKWTLFRVHERGDDQVRLESNELKGKFVSVKPNGEVNVGNGGFHTNFSFLRQGEGIKGGEFNHSYVFKKKGKEVVIKHKHDGYLRVEKDGNELSSKGGQGKFARFIVHFGGNDDHVRIQSKHNGKYIRIEDGKINCGKFDKFGLFKVHSMGDKLVKLESVEEDGKYLSVKPDGNVNCGTGGKHTELEFLRD